MWKDILLVLSILGLLTACTLKEKSMLDTMEGNTGVVDKPLGFDPMGSDSGNIKGLATVHFGYDRSDLSPEARDILVQNAKFMNENKNISFQLEGHCDSRGSTEYNLTLGERRGNEVKSHLVGLGVAESRLSVLSYGEEKPISTGDSESDHARNRRVNFVPMQ